MTEPLFFKQDHALTLREIVALTGAVPRVDPGALDPLDLRIVGVAALDEAGPHDLAFFDNPKYAGQLAATQAGACLVSPRFAADAVPGHVVALSVAEPFRAFVTVMRTMFPGALQPSSPNAAGEIAPGSHVDPTARLESGVTVEPGAVIGPRVEIGAGSMVGAGAVIGAGVRIGRDCAIGATVTIHHAIIGDRVVVHPGCHFGQDGFGYVLGGGGHLKVPQIGRVIIQNDVEVGAGTTIDRGALRDTVIGEGSKIDNLVQLGHNVVVGRHCVVAAHCAIAGSTTLEDFVVLGGRVSINNHITVGEGAQVAAGSGIIDNVPPGERWAGAPAQPARAWFRELALIKRLAARGPAR